MEGAGFWIAKANGQQVYAFAHERFRNEEVGLFWMKKNERKERLNATRSRGTQGGEAERKRKEKDEGKRSCEREREIERDEERDSSRSGSR